jgi:hypothetical protein
VLPAVNTPIPAGCKPSHAFVLGRPHTSFGMRPPCVLGLLGFRSADQDRTCARKH